MSAGGGGVVYCELSQHGGPSTPVTQAATMAATVLSHLCRPRTSASVRSEVLLTIRAQAGGRPGSGLPPSARVLQF